MGWLLAWVVGDLWVRKPDSVVSLLPLHTYTHPHTYSSTQVKGRPLTDPLIAHVARTEDAWAVFRCGAENDNDVSPHLSTLFVAKKR